MSQRTFILTIDKINEDLVEDADIVNLLTIRMVEIYLSISSVDKVKMDVIQNIKNFIIKNIKVSEKNNLLYSIDIDFEKDISLE